MRYAIVIERGEKSYGAYVPDLPGCVAAAEREDDGISSGVTRHGPSGRNVSNVFPRDHCPPPNLICQSRALPSSSR